MPVHLVRAGADLLHAQGINRPGMLPGPTLDFACLAAVFGNDRGETTVCWDHDVSCVGLQRSGGHVLDGISVAGCNGEVVVLLVRVGLFRGTSNGHPHALGGSDGVEDFVRQPLPVQRAVGFHWQRHLLLKSLSLGFASRSRLLVNRLADTLSHSARNGSRSAVQLNRQNVHDVVVSRHVHCDVFAMVSQPMDPLPCGTLPSRGVCCLGSCGGCA